ncbi:glycosyltransferase [Limosilactobacillus reuteri]|uniref:glycosyltransferase n=1 Tax=Limosilactobacillus reuteri TaxID=1598 RepID=UPI001E2C3E57|nr:glycosyltransferase [Limosilactobacillus reuteri]MCC4357480.1 glycosyltransferase [Limosilactobacillus reuteri]MCC4361925.1 glycosyltransferase [Limosilactobacillus reuteri]MCC4363686.1 glycosyltransferase [Limosilactobacillus reuteri]
MKKRILVIGLTERMGGVETFIYNTTRFSNKGKYEYDFLVHGTDHAVFQNEINKFYGNGNHFYFIPSFKKKPLNAIKALLLFYKNNGNKYDFVHLETGAASELVYVFPFCLMNHIKLISHSHNGGGYSPIINSVFRPLLNLYSSTKLACSVEASNWLFGSKNINKVKIINNGIDTNRFQFNEKSRKRIRKQYQLDNDTFVIGHIGRFSEQKNHDFLIKIFSEVKRLRPNSKLLLLGVGELQSSIRKQVKLMNLDKDVIFCDLKSNTQDYYSAFDVFVMPSLYEGLPVVGIEAQSEGLPCFFSSNISNLIKITDNANIIPLTDNAKKWANKIVSVSNIINSRKNYAGIVSDKGFSIESTVKELEKIYGV